MSELNLNNRGNRQLQIDALKRALKALENNEPTEPVQIEISDVNGLQTIINDLQTRLSNLEAEE